MVFLLEILPSMVNLVGHILRFQTVNLLVFSAQELRIDVPRFICRCANISTKVTGMIILKLIIRAARALFGRARRFSCSYVFADRHNNLLSIHFVSAWVNRRQHLFLCIIINPGTKITGMVEISNSRHASKDGRARRFSCSQVVADRHSDLLSVHFVSACVNRRQFLFLCIRHRY